MRTQRPVSRNRGNIHDGLGTMPRALGSAIFTEHAWEEISRSLNLSGRELEVVRRIFDDHTESTIAADLGISAHTVHTHLDRLHHKLGVVDRVQLILRITNEFLALTVSGASSLPPLCAKPLHRPLPLAHAVVRTQVQPRRSWAFRRPRTSTLGVGPYSLSPA